MSKITTINNDFLVELVKNQILENKKRLFTEDSLEFYTPGGVDKMFDRVKKPTEQKEPDSDQKNVLDADERSALSKFKDAAQNSLIQTAQNFKRWSNKKLYNNDREQAVAQIDSKDPEIKFIKEFFSLYSAVCYGSSTYINVFPEAWAIEDPGTYCVQPKIKNNLETWYKKNRKKFLKEMMESNKTPDAFYEICSEYAEDFLSTFDYFGFRIELGEQKLTISEQQAGSIIKTLLQDKSFTSNWRSQWHGRSPCVLDCFVLFFKFIYNLNFTITNERPSLYKIQRIGKRVAKDFSYLPVIASQKSKTLVRMLRREADLRKKWTGFCYNMTFDPYGENNLNSWTDLSKDPLERKFKKSHYDSYAENGIVLTADLLATGIVATAASAKIINGIRTAALGLAPMSGGMSVLVGVLASFGISAFIMWDPFDFLTIRDNVQDELNEMASLLTQLKKLATEDKVSDSEIKSIEKEFREAGYELYNLLHEVMTAALQRDITNVKANFRDKKIALAKLQRILELLSYYVNRVSFKKEELNVEVLDEAISHFQETVKQIGSIGEEASKWDDKIMNDIGARESIRGVENLHRAFLSPLRRIKEGKLYELDVSDRGASSDVAAQVASDQPDAVSNINTPSTSSTTNASSNVSIKNYEKWKNILVKTYSWVDLDEPGETLTRARSWVDKELGPFIDSQGNFKKNKASLAKTHPKVLEKLKPGSESGSLTNYSDFFISWISNYSMYDETDKAPKPVTVLDPRWYLSANGLRSRGSLEGNPYFPQVGALRAYAGIGLGHKITNTSFYYTSNNKLLQGFAGAPQGGTIISVLKDRSRVKITDGKVTIEDGGVQISRLRELANNPKNIGIDEVIELSKAIENELKRLKGEEIGGESGNKQLELRIMQILLKVYYYKTSLGHSLVEKILKKDDYYSKKMENYGVKLSRLSSAQQNSQVHQTLLSLLRQAACYKIILFEALLSFDF